jgi:hypothetical protein
MLEAYLPATDEVCSLESGGRPELSPNSWVRIARGDHQYADIYDPGILILNSQVRDGWSSLEIKGTIGSRRLSTASPGSKSRLMCDSDLAGLCATKAVSPNRQIFETIPTSNKTIALPCVHTSSSPAVRHPGLGLDVPRGLHPDIVASHDMLL